MTLSLISDSRPTPLELDLTKPEALVGLKKNRELSRTLGEGRESLSIRVGAQSGFTDGDLCLIFTAVVIKVGFSNRRDARESLS